MNQKLTVGLLTFFYFSTLLAGEPKNIGFSGFQALEVTQTSMKLQFREEKTFVISKIKFSSEDQAKSFCEENGLNLDPKGFEKTLLLAMSGAATFNDEIAQAISFKLTDKYTGIATWTGSNNEVKIMWDGHGTATETGKMEDISKFAEKLGAPSAPALSAVCE